MTPGNLLLNAVPPGSGSRRLLGRLKLAVWTTGLAFFWLAVLPWLSAIPVHREKLDWLREQRVDPSAMYYTEVEAMEPMLQRLNERGRR
jgi:hypothetical protein